MIMQTVNIQFRVDAKLKSDAEKILEGMGFDISTLLKATLKRVVKVKDFPFAIGTNADIDVNGLTKKQQKQLDAALKESKLKGPFRNADDFINSLNA
jgi:addiction module RelB/DinJ family antitoxin